MKCYLQKPSEVERKWYLVDAKGKTLGRLSTEIATVLRGKNKVTFTPNVDGGDYVVVINAEQVQVTGKKRQNKVYRHHTGYIGNLKEINFDKLLVKNPTKIIEYSVRGMLPKNKLRADMMKRLRIFAGPEHPHQAQKVEVLEFN
ncbi:50S ribosomal protein L13 [Criibacterium bergeronii]|uniref:Large ribosomal subunit protein uL13 n=1 Tax=Criibacterium bergeronii TaxID=1871336 RepID=A0A371IKH6_9FIRM|nr:50S ribosomal protein L13 [Criibacterium bergeronii]MBS6063133.1 50S ribosomal protein L13 [Peptostreptococcaceae bacterium]RDY20966.1 50S ribosomal protein L13 [Criibacterium bergeronii]TRW26996.1 50S ribosomal protein L13 [Criibacterium bergeronii]